jgi:hypothetical protein
MIARKEYKMCTFRIVNECGEEVSVHDSIEEARAALAVVEKHMDGSMEYTINPKFIVCCGYPEQWETADTIEEARQLARENAYMDDGEPVPIRMFDFIELTS